MLCTTYLICPCPCQNCHSNTTATQILSILFVCWCCCFCFVLFLFQLPLKRAYCNVIIMLHKGLIIISIYMLNWQGSSRTPHGDYKVLTSRSKSAREEVGQRLLHTVCTCASKSACGILSLVVRKSERMASVTKTVLVCLCAWASGNEKFLSLVLHLIMKKKKLMLKLY